MNPSIAPVSVVVPCFRCAGTLRRAVESVALQTVRPAELILVDDASGDSTGALLVALQAQHGAWIKLLSLSVNGGAASARNAGWQMATQTYVAFLDSDDAWHPRKIEIQVAYMQSHPEVTLSGHLSRQLPAEGADESPWWPIVHEGAAERVCLAGLLLRHAFVTPSVMLRRDIAMRFADGLRHMEDHRLWLDIVSAELTAVKLMVELVAIYKPAYGASGLSADMWRMEIAELANYRYIHSKGKISSMQRYLLQAYSLVKYVRRLLIVRLLHRA